MAGDDQKFLERLKRFDSPAAVAKSYRELEQKVSSGQLKPPPAALPADATPEQVTAWRKEQGLPDNAEAFIQSLELPQGVVPGEADKPLLASFAEDATAAGWTQKQYNEAVSWFYKVQDNLLAERDTLDNDHWLETQTELLREWGPNFKGKQNTFNNSLTRMFPQELVPQVLNARLPDGTKMFGHSGVLKAWIDMAESLNPIQTAMPSVSGATMASADARIAEIETKYLRAPRNSPEGKAYWEGGVSQEYNQLLAARETMRERQGASR